MLSALRIQNFALIENLQVDFDSGFTIITGETGAGKSILLGGLSLVLGKRADLSSLRDKDRKCIIEATFNIAKYNLRSFFQDNDLDFESETIIRREILPSGKSRAFVNDSPVNLSVLNSLGNQLIDIHSQHQTLELTQDEFQLQVIDAVADNLPLLDLYTSVLKNYNHTKQQLQDYISQQSNAMKDSDYNNFLLKELEDAKLEKGMQELLESTYSQLSNVEYIKESLSKMEQLFSDEQYGTTALLSELKITVSKLSDLGEEYQTIFERINSVAIEMEDIFSEVTYINEVLEDNPSLLNEVNERLQLIHNLFQKHQVLTVEELLDVQSELELKVQATDNLSGLINEKEEELKILENQLEDLVMKLREKRQNSIPQIAQSLESTLKELGMPNASFKIDLEPSDIFLKSGKDRIQFLFSANKGSQHGELKKVASGGELSRIMLSIKALLAKYMQLPTIMFDEIDTGVSGEISQKMADIMKEMSTSMQVFSITHLPQVASKGDAHYKVFKDHSSEITTTEMKLLTNEERILELAEMLGGKELTDSAIAHAKQLLN